MLCMVYFEIVTEDKVIQNYSKITANQIILIL